jgi:hypothetical protein
MCAYILVYMCVQHMCANVCILVYMRVHVHLSKFINTGNSKHVYVHICAYCHIKEHVCVHAYTHANAYEHTHTHISTCTFTHAYTHAHTHTHTLYVYVYVYVRVHVCTCICIFLYYIIEVQFTCTGVCGHTSHEYTRNKHLYAKHNDAL